MQGAACLPGLLLTPVAFGSGCSSDPHFKPAWLVWPHEESRNALVGSDLPLARLQVETESRGAGRTGLSVSERSSGAKRVNGRLQSTLGSLLESHRSETKDAFLLCIPQQGPPAPASP